LLAVTVLFAAGAAPVRAAGSSGGTVKIIYPNGGEVLEAGATTQVKWQSRGIGGNMVIILYKKGIKHSVIARQTPNNGRFSWNIPNSLAKGNDYRIRIRALSDLSVNDFSDRNFTIR
jgi:hypothetical protein